MIPTEGWVDVKGRIAALLELASGFDNDLTVRENAYLRGALLGYTREFMNEKYDDIIEFAELQDFQERRFKQLSSGMKSRLAFSIACLVEPDILILDEVLSVGDGAFRKKSENKMRSILESGVTAILVSHTIGQVRDMSNKVLWLDKGKQICFSDEVELVCDAYEEFLATKKVPHSWEDIESLAEDFTVRQEKKRAEKAKTEQQKLVEKLRKTDTNVAKAAIEAYLKEVEEAAAEEEEKTE
jgi:ABC-2 type transport system ATP-binding protein